MDQYVVLSTFFFRVYGLVWRLIRPCLHLKKRLREGWGERQAPVGWASPADVWLQTASGGEARLVLSILAALPENVKMSVFLTTWTKQGKEVLEMGLPKLLDALPGLQAQVRYAPLDEPGIVRRALAQVKPRLLILLETELWPGLLGACAESGIPVQIFNGRMSKTSFELYRGIRPVLRELPICRIHAISGEDAARFAWFYSKDTSVPCEIAVAPNIKFDQAAESLQTPPSRALMPLFRKVGLVFLLASVRKQEEKHMAIIIGKLFEFFPRAALIVAPRHMERVLPWFERMNDLGFDPLLASKISAKGSVKEGQVLIWDKFGDLPHLYAVADVAFVGGSFNQGGQNFLEALAAGLTPCVGPSLDNFRWALGREQPPTLEEAGLLIIADNTRDLLKKMEAAALNLRNREDVRDDFRKWLDSRTGGAQRAARDLLASLNGAPARQ